MRARNLTRIVTAAVAVSAVALGTAACATGPSSDVTELSFFHRWPDDPKNSYFEQLIADFEEQNPDIRVTIESVVNDSYKDKVKVVAGSNRAPDVMFTWSGSFIEELVAADSALDLDEWLAENPDIESSFYESQLTPFEVDGAQYALPVGMQAKLFFYNKDVFDDLGLEVPSTWDEFIDVLSTIQDSGLTPIEFGAQEQWPIAHYLGTLNQRVVAPDVFEADQEATSGAFTDDGYELALERFQDLAEYMNPDMTAVTHEAARNSWIAGDAAIFYMQGVESAQLQDADFEYGTFNFPGVEGGEGDAQQLTGAPEGFFVSSTTEHPDEALRLLEFILDYDNAVSYVEQTSELSAVKGAVEAADTTEVLKEITTSIVEASAMAPWLDNAYDATIVQTYLAETQLMLAGERSPAEVMDAVRATAG